MIKKTGHVPFELKDFFHKDPIRDICSKSQDKPLVNTYGAYLEYLRSLSIVWQRIRKECKDVGAIYVRFEKMGRDDSWKEESVQLVSNQLGLMNVLQFDVEAFILFARIFMDKVGQLIEKLVNIPQGRQPGKSFTAHKKYFIRHRSIHPAYSDLLQNEIHWYEQELLFLRDRIFAHGEPLFTATAITPDSGVSFRRMAGTFRLKDYNKKKLLPVIAKYEKRYPDLKITRNEFGMLDDFLQQIREHDYRLDKDDVCIIRDIVSGTGISVDEEFMESIAKHIEDYLRQVAVIFRPD
jgi:hypothetical protein